MKKMLLFAILMVNLFCLRAEEISFFIDESKHIIVNAMTYDNYPLRVLIDTGASHSITTTHIGSLALTRLNETLEIKGINGASEITLFCTFDLVGFGRIYPHFVENSPIENIDIILGMDWLIYYDAQIDLINKVIKFRKDA